MRFAQCGAVGATAGNQCDMGAKGFMDRSCQIFPEVFCRIGKGGKNENLADWLIVAVGRRMVDLGLNQLAKTNELCVTFWANQKGVIEQVLQLIPILAHCQFPFRQIEVLEINLVLTPDLEVFGVKIEIIEILIAEIRDLCFEGIDFLNGPPKSKAKRINRTLEAF